MPGMICPVVMYVPIATMNPIIAARPFSSSASCSRTDASSLFISLGGVSLAKMFCLPYSVITVIELKAR